MNEGWNSAAQKLPPHFEDHVHFFNETIPPPLSAPPKGPPPPSHHQHSPPPPLNHVKPSPYLSPHITDNSIISHSHGQPQTATSSSPRQLPTTTKNGFECFHESVDRVLRSLEDSYPNSTLGDRLRTLACFVDTFHDQAASLSVFLTKPLPARGDINAPWESEDDEMEREEEGSSSSDESNGGSAKSEQESRLSLPQQEQEEEQRREGKRHRPPKTVGVILPDREGVAYGSPTPDQQDERDRALQRRRQQRRGGGESETRKRDASSPSSMEHQWDSHDRQQSQPRQRGDPAQRSSPPNDAAAAATAAAIVTDPLLSHRMTLVATSLGVVYRQLCAIPSLRAHHDWLRRTFLDCCEGLCKDAFLFIAPLQLKADLAMYFEAKSARKEEMLQQRRAERRQSRLIHTEQQQQQVAGSSNKAPTTGPAAPALHNSINAPPLVHVSTLLEHSTAHVQTLRAFIGTIFEGPRSLPAAPAVSTTTSPRPPRAVADPDVAEGISCTNARQPNNPRHGDGESTLGNPAPEVMHLQQAALQLETFLNGFCTHPKLLRQQLQHQGDLFTELNKQWRHATGVTKWLHRAMVEWKQFNVRLVFTAWRKLTKESKRDQEDRMQLQNQLSVASTKAEEKTRQWQQATQKLNALQVMFDRERREERKLFEEERAEFRASKRQLIEYSEQIEDLNRQLVSMEAKMIFHKAEAERMDEKLRRFYRSTRFMASSGNTAAAPGPGLHKSAGRGGGGGGSGVGSRASVLTTMTIMTRSQRSGDAGSFMEEPPFEKGGRVGATHSPQERGEPNDDFDSSSVSPSSPPLRMETTMELIKRASRPALFSLTTNPNEGGGRRKFRQKDLFHYTDAAPLEPQRSLDEDDEEEGDDDVDSIDPDDDEAYYTLFEGLCELLEDAMSHIAPLSKESLSWTASLQKLAANTTTTTSAGSSSAAAAAAAAAAAGVVGATTEGHSMKVRFKTFEDLVDCLVGKYRVRLDTLRTTLESTTNTKSHHGYPQSLLTTKDPHHHHGRSLSPNVGAGGGGERSSSRAKSPNKPSVARKTSSAASMMRRPSSSSMAAREASPRPGSAFQRPGTQTGTRTRSQLSAPVASTPVPPRSPSTSSAIAALHPKALPTNTNTPIVFTLDPPTADAAVGGSIHISDNGLVVHAPPSSHQSHPPQSAVHRTGMNESTTAPLNNMMQRDVQTAFFAQLHDGAPQQKLPLLDTALKQWNNSSNSNNNSVRPGKSGSESVASHSASSILLPPSSNSSPPPPPPAPIAIDSLSPLWIRLLSVAKLKDPSLPSLLPYFQLELGKLLLTTTTEEGGHHESWVTAMQANLEGWLNNTTAETAVAAVPSGTPQPQGGSFQMVQPMDSLTAGEPTAGGDAASGWSAMRIMVSDGDVVDPNTETIVVGDDGRVAAKSHSSSPKPLPPPPPVYGLRALLPTAVVEWILSEGHPHHAAAAKSVGGTVKTSLLGGGSPDPRSLTPAGSRRGSSFNVPSPSRSPVMAGLHPAMPSSLGPPHRGTPQPPSSSHHHHPHHRGGGSGGHGGILHFQQQQRQTVVQLLPTLLYAMYELRPMVSSVDLTNQPGGVPLLPRGQDTRRYRTFEEKEALPAFCEAREEPRRLAKMRAMVRQAWLRGQAMQALQTKAAVDVLLGILTES